MYNLVLVSETLGTQTTLPHPAPKIKKFKCKVTKFISLLSLSDTDKYIFHHHETNNTSTKHVNLTKQVGCFHGSIIEQ